MFRIVLAPGARLFDRDVGDEPCSLGEQRSAGSLVAADEQAFARHHDLSAEAVRERRDACNALVCMLVRADAADLGVYATCVRPVVTSTLCWWVPDWAVVLRVERVARGRRVVSVGCGYGYFEHLLSRYAGVDVLGVDTFAETLDDAAQCARRAAYTTDARMHRLFVLDMGADTPKAGARDGDGSRRVHDLVADGPRMWLGDDQVRRVVAVGGGGGGIDGDNDTANDDDTGHGGDGVPLVPFAADDVLFVGWGRAFAADAIERYAAAGGDTVLIVGERGDGCTFPADYMPQTTPDWHVEYVDMYHYAGVNDVLAIWRRRARRACGARRRARSERADVIHVRRIGRIARARAHTH